MSVRSLLGKILVFTMLEIGVYSGVRITPQEIEKIMQVMHRTKVEHVVKKEHTGE
ncbi:MAG TPA: hypothetical protein VFV49_11835 [Thermoanaerobaculia bacterium]|nr:hypothetical protein [Thermoanaerobaculia bacterium]